jgi:hypothetical protein
MRRFIVGLMAIGLLAFAGQAQAENNGTGDPLGLIASGAIQPFWAAGDSFTIIEITSPVGFNSAPETLNLHAIYFNATCARLLSVPFPVTMNGIRLLSPDVDGATFNGLAVIGSSPNGLDLVPLENPIHVKGHWFNFGLDIARVADPISLDAAESLPIQTWNPLRSGADFISPVEGADSLTTIYLVCPSSAVIATVPAARGFPPAPSIASTIDGIIYDDDENKLRDFQVSCSCLTTIPIRTIPGGSVYADAGATGDNFYTELFTTGAAFLGYMSRVDTSGLFPGGQGDYFTRLHNGSWQAIGLGNNTPGLR